MGYAIPIDLIKQEIDELTSGFFGLTGRPEMGSYVPLSDQVALTASQQRQLSSNRRYGLPISSIMLGYSQKRRVSRQAT